MEPYKTCRACNGDGGWVKYNVWKKINEITECQFCDGHGSIAYGVESASMEDDRDYTDMYG